MKLLDRLIIILIVIIIISISGFSRYFNYESLVTTFVIPITFLLIIFRNKFKLKILNNTYVFIYFTLICYAILYLPFVLNYEAANKEIFKLIGALTCMLIIFEVKDFKNIIQIALISQVLAFYLITINLILNIGLITELSFVDRSTETLGLNANVFAVASYFANISLFYLIELTKKKLYIFLSLFTLFLAYYVSFVVATRQGLTFNIIISITYWLFIYNTNRRFLMFRLTLIIVFVYGCLLVLSSFYNDSYLKLRIDESLAEGDSRQFLIQGAYRVFISNPIFGVGPGQFRFMNEYAFPIFSHNSFTEIGANYGAIGIILIFILFFQPLIIEIVKFSKTFKIQSLNYLNILFFLTFILYNNFYTFYLTTNGMLFFSLILIIQSKINQEGIQIIK
jgi:O-antigen ligase